MHHCAKFSVRAAGQVIRPVLGITMGPPALISRLNIDGVLVYSAPRGGPAGDAGIQGCQRSQFGDLVVGMIFSPPGVHFSDALGFLYASIISCCLFTDVSLECDLQQTVALCCASGCCAISLAFSGCLLKCVTPHSSQWTSLMLTGDIIIGLNGKKIRNYADLFESLDEYKPGDKVTVDVYRTSTRKQVSIPVELGQRTPEVQDG
jgi:S1-C subfamily serine protease